MQPPFQPGIHPATHIQIPPTHHQQIPQHGPPPPHPPPSTNPTNPTSTGPNGQIPQMTMSGPHTTYPPPNHYQNTHPFINSGHINPTQHINAAQHINTAQRGPPPNPYQNIHPMINPITPIIPPFTNPYRFSLSFILYPLSFILAHYY